MTPEAFGWPLWGAPWRGGAGRGGTSGGVFLRHTVIKEKVNIRLTTASPSSSSPSASPRQRVSGRLTARTWDTKKTVSQLLNNSVLLTWYMIIPVEVNAIPDHVEAIFVSHQYVQSSSLSCGVEGTASPCIPAQWGRIWGLIGRLWGVWEGLGTQVFNMNRLHSH